MTEVLLRAVGLGRRFGGLAAVAGVDLAFRRGEIHAVIGPNGAGKSTLLDLLSGALQPSEGRVELDGRDVTGLAADQVARRGVGRSYQKTNIFAEFDVAENCRLAAQARLVSSWRFLRPAEAYAGPRDMAERVMALTGLAGRRHRRAATLSHGEKRQLEIAMALATAPSVLLLDEPMAGMGADETGRVVELIRRLRIDHAIVLVEHDLDAVFELADVLTVMVAGRVLASGDPATIRGDAAVQDAYLGTEPP